MSKQSNRKKINNLNRQRWGDAAGVLWDLAANRQNPNAIRILAEIIGLDKIAPLLILKTVGDRTADAEALKLITRAIERTAVRS